jgi:hypothetical protein
MASSIATSSGTSGRFRISCTATRRMLRSSGAIRSSDHPVACLAIDSSSEPRSASTPSTSSRVNGLAPRSTSSGAGRPVTSDW